MRSKLLIQNLAIGAALIGTLFQPAFASDSKVYPGGLCQATNGKHEVNLLHGGSTFNNQTSKSGFVRVTCPIVRDSVSGTNGIRAIVNVSRNAQADPNQALICRVSTLRKDGQTFVTRSFSHRGSGGLSHVSRKCSQRNRSLSCPG
ncbi:MAG: hypothetical protein ACPW60_13515 [Methylohalobius sp. ZOD2]